MIKTGFGKWMLPATLAMASLLLSACGGRRENVVRQDNNSFNTPDARLCLGKLKAAEVRFQSLPNQDNGGGCHLIDTVKLLDFGTEATNLGAMTCPLAANFTAWARYAARPAAKLYLGSELMRIETMGTYNCRNIGGGRSGKLSEHAHANAVDVSAFVLQDGHRISVLNGWNGSPSERDFLRRIRSSACKRFGTVLSPDFNAAHANHLHFDMGHSMKDGSGYCR
jgi:hypothetical protein